MCGFTAFFPNVSIAATNRPAQLLQESLSLISHRGPDARETWRSGQGECHFAHARLSIIDLATGNQPLTDRSGRYTILYNGEIYNYKQLRSQWALECDTQSDTEVILQAYIRLGSACLRHFRGMFAFVIWDEYKHQAFVARDRFGIKPLYFVSTSKGFALSSEIKGILPFLDSRDLSQDALGDYLNFQFPLSGRTLFADVHEFPTAHSAIVNESGLSELERYWKVNYTIDYSHTESWFAERLRGYLEDSVILHCTADVPIGSYVSGGIDSTLISALSAKSRNTDLPKGFVGRYLSHSGFDESAYAQLACNEEGIECHIVDITPEQFIESYENLIWHLDFPVAGPGAFGQYVVSREAAKHVKVILGGQGGDEIFGGYTRYLIGYFEQCIKGAIDGTLHDGNFVVTYESIIPSLRSLAEYKPLLQEFWSKGLFDSLDLRYWRLINRASSYESLISADLLSSPKVLESFMEIFYRDGTEHASYFDRMSHFDFNTLLPALLQVEDRVSMAHGLESRVPFLDHTLVDFAATIPADIKFKGGKLKRLLPIVFQNFLPKPILERKDKMGFPIPLNNWIRDHKGVREYVGDILNSRIAQQRPYLTKSIPVDELLSSQGSYGRALWGLLSLEVWQRLYID